MCFLASARLTHGNKRLDIDSVKDPSTQARLTTGFPHQPFGTRVHQRWLGTSYRGALIRVSAMFIAGMSIMKRLEQGVLSNM
jgi:hypothetical protein